MPAKILSGREFADSINAETRTRVEKFASAARRPPGLAVVRVGEDPASQVYVTKKVATARELGIASHHHHLDEATETSALLDIVATLNDDETIDGILVQLPLPRHIDERAVLESVSPFKDVDGFHPLNVGNLWLGHRSLAPCTPAGVIEILKHSGISLEGREAVIVGRSNIVGKPMAALLLKENATVTIAHSRTADLQNVTRRADILIAAVGRPAFLTVEHIKEGAVVIDVGINRYEDVDKVETVFASEDSAKREAAIRSRGYTLIGDVNQRDALEQAAHFTPVPGGVGLLTVAMLMKNTLDAAEMRKELL